MDVEGGETRLDDSATLPPPTEASCTDNPTALMQRIAAAGSGTGMHFAGIPMTVEKAFTVGTILFYLTRYFGSAKV